MPTDRAFLRRRGALALAAGAALAAAGPAQAAFGDDTIRLVGIVAAFGLGQLLALALGLGLIFLLTFLIPGRLTRALARAPLLFGLAWVAVPRLRVGPWSVKALLGGLAVAVLAALLLELRGETPDYD